MRRKLGLAVLGVLSLALLTAGASVGEAQVSVRDVDRSQEASVSVVQRNGEGLNVQIYKNSGSDGSGYQKVTVDASQESSVSESSGVGSDVSGASTEVSAGGDEMRPVEKARILASRPASGVAGVSRRREVRILRDQIYARPVGEVSKGRYKELYKSAAERYGFGKDWYVLAAVGWVESRHGEDMGVSSAGAIGPMQFLPSTWKSSGVDGNGDGIRNIMDPEDAIPAAARYLKRGGAPDDWTAALYTYNHSESYVNDVFRSAERYRGLAKDGSVGPYGRESVSRSSR